MTTRVESERSFKAGATAYHDYPDDNPDDHCPHYSKSGGDNGRTDWMRGWYHQRIEERLGNILRKYGEEW